MKVSCNVIQDLLPLYVEGMLSQDSKSLVEEHLDDCNDCKSSFSEMQSSNTLQIDTDTTPLNNLKIRLHKSKMHTILFTAMLTVVAVILIMYYLTAPDFIDYSEENITIKDAGNELVVAEFDDNVYGYDLESSKSEDNDGYIYHITTWDSKWNNISNKSNVNNTVLNPNGENVVSVYYYQVNGDEDILIYGRNTIPNGGVVTLPRLVLGYYMIIGIGLAIVLGLMCIAFRNNKKAINVLSKLFLLPVSYLIAHVLVMGFEATSYVAALQFIKILFLMIPIYIGLLIILNLIKRYKGKISSYS